MFYGKQIGYIHMSDPALRVWVDEEKAKGNIVVFVNGGARIHQPKK